MVVPACLIIGVRGLLAFPYGIAGGAFAIAVAVFSAVVLVTNLREPVWSARFYEDGVRLEGRSHRWLPYPEIGQVSYEQKFSPIHPYERLTIKTRKGETFLTYGNPFSRNLDTDLYSWLNSKIAAIQVDSR